MTYFIYLVSALLHGLSLLYAATLAKEALENNRTQARLAMWVVLIFYISGLMTSIVAGYLMFSEALQ
jgi:hypothetical protein